MIARRLPTFAVALGLCAVTPSIALGQQSPAANGSGGAIYAMVGRINFTADESFDAVLGDSSGVIFGGGARFDLGIGGWYLDVGAWRFQQTGERVFVFQGQAYPLGVPVEVTATPVEITGGWRFRLKRWPKLTPYAGGGLMSMAYREETAASNSLENDEKTFNGLLVRAGAEYKITKWVGVGGEASWSSLPDALGDGGASKAFDETDLGGTTLRFKIIVGK